MRAQWVEAMLFLHNMSLHSAYPVDPSAALDASRSADTHHQRRHKAQSVIDSPVPVWHSAVS